MPKSKNSKPEKKSLLGVQTGKNKNNGFSWVRLHYTADPAKRGHEWKKKAQFGMEKKAWMTEMELSWQTYAGDPVYGEEFSPDVHVIDDWKPDPEYPQLLRGWDFGGNHSCVVAQYLAGTLYIIDEYPNMGYNTRRIAKQIQEDCNLKYGQHFRFVDIIDPSGMWEGKTSDGKACGDVMRELNMELVPGIQDVSRRIDSVMRLLITMQAGKPKLMINKHCRMLIDGFKGGYHYPEKETQNQKHNRPVKNEFSHIHDGLQYICTRLDSVDDAYHTEISITSLKGPNFDI